jgi:PAS domain S-box-containing protein
MFMVVASITLFFERTWNIYQGIQRDKLALQRATEELISLNQNLEQMVADRTQELTLSEHKYRRIFEVSKDIILVTQSDGTIADINPEGCALLANSAAVEDLQGISLNGFFADPAEWQSIRGDIDRRGFVSNAEVVIKRSNGVTHHVLISATSAPGAGEEEETIHFVIRDIEQKRMMEQQMSQADRLASIGELSAGIAHEINNPLGIILGYTQLMIRAEDPKNDRYSDLRTVEKHARSCKAIVEDLLNFARSSRPHKDAVQIHTVIDDVLRFLEQHTHFDNIDITRTYGKDIPSILVDEKKIRQVLMNLIMNARHAIGQSGTIRLQTQINTNGTHLQIKVIDNGYGIEQKNLGRIFDPFFTTKPTGQGTGLGLSVSYGIIKGHDGDIYVDSEPGVCTTFTVELPLNRRVENEKTDTDR